MGSHTDRLHRASICENHVYEILKISYDTNYAKCLNIFRFVGYDKKRIEMNLVLIKSS